MKSHKITTLKNKSMIKVLILGGNGYLGTVFINNFKKKIKLDSPQRRKLNLFSIKQIDKFFSKNNLNYNIIINFCVYQQTGPYLVKNAKQVKDLNNLLNKNILYLWKKYLPNSKMISMGASCAYSPYRKGFSYTKGKLFGGTKDFALSKRIFAKGCDALFKKFKMKYIILVPGTLIGPGEQLNAKKMHFFNGGLLRAALYKNKIKKNFRFIMNRNVIRELSSVDEVSYQIYKILKTKKTGIINLNPNYRISLEQFYGLIENKLKIKKSGNFKSTIFNASISKSYRVFVKHDFSKKKSIINMGFLNLFDRTYKYFSKAISKKL
ncbi:MAG: hypothetical protein CMM99_01315 [Rickettsiales bacterium]|nr:hypothetical protein [Rickettsiales bacterium]